jgi:hypothetical protein
MKVYKRTSEGKWAAFDDLSPLPRKLRILLKAVNGKAPEEVYIKSLSAFGDVHALLQSLEQAGLIADRGQRSSSKPSAAMAPPTPAQPTPQRPNVMPVVALPGLVMPGLVTPIRAAAAPTVHTAAAGPKPAPAGANMFERTEVLPNDRAHGGRSSARPVEWQVLPVLTDDAPAPQGLPLRMPVLGLPGDPPTLTTEMTDPVALAAMADLADLADLADSARLQTPPASKDAFVAGPAWGASAAAPVGLAVNVPAPAFDATNPAALALADLAALSARDAMADLAALAESSARAVPSHEASPLASISPENLLAHNALMAAANDEPIADAATTRATVRHAVELMSNFLLDHVPRAASQVLPEVESIHSLEQWAELMDGYAAFVAPAGELGRLHLLQIRRMLAQALQAADVGSKGWYA